jgi:hypothetical protein
MKHELLEIRQLLEMEITENALSIIGKVQINCWG